MMVEELDVAARLILAQYGMSMQRGDFDEVAACLVTTLGERDRLWARYLMACQQRRANGD